MTNDEKSDAQKIADDFIERNKDALDRLARDGGGEDDTEDVMSEVMSVPDSETLKDICEALYDDVKAEYVNELDEKAHDTLHAGIHYMSVFYQVVRQREKNGVRGRQEIREKGEELQERLNPGEESPRQYRDEGILDALLWVAKWRDEL